MGLDFVSGSGFASGSGYENPWARLPAVSCDLHTTMAYMYSRIDTSKLDYSIQLQV